MTRKDISTLHNRMNYVEKLIETISAPLDNSSKTYPQYEHEEPAVIPKAKRADEIWIKVTEYIKVLIDVINRPRNIMKYTVGY